MRVKAQGAMPYAKGLDTTAAPCLVVSHVSCCTRQRKNTHIHEGGKKLHEQGGSFGR